MRSSRVSKSFPGDEGVGGVREAEQEAIAGEGVLVLKAEQEDIAGEIFSTNRLGREEEIAVSAVLTEERLALFMTGRKRRSSPTNR